MSSCNASIFRSKPLKAFDLLGVTADATEAEINSAYRKLSLASHPDKGGDEKQFITLTDAKDFCIEAINNPWLLLSPPALPSASPSSTTPPASPFSASSSSPFPSPPSRPRTQEELFNAFFPGQKYEDLTEDEKKPFTYSSAGAQTHFSFFGWAEKIRGRREERRARKQQRQEQEEKQRKFSAEQAIFAEAERLTKMQEELRSRGIRC